MAERIERLYRSHWNWFVTTAERALGDAARASAQDLVAEVMDDVRRGRFALLPAADRDAARFIAGVIRQRARHVNRREARSVSLSEHEPAAAPCDPWARAAQILLARDLADALRQLTPRERQVATMHWLQQWSGPQIATELGISVSTVKELLRRAGRRLRAHLDHYDEAGA